MFSLPYGKSKIEFELPPHMHGDVLVSQPYPTLSDVECAIREALDNPVASPSLESLAGSGSRVCIGFTDITRACPDQLLVPAILNRLGRVGVRDADITLLCSIGMHRPSTYAERVQKLGAEVVDRYRVIDNEPQNPQALVDLGTTEGGVPVLVHRAAVETDLLISTGLVEPHQYAGYSGGRKTVAVGAAGEALIAYTHGPAFLDHPGTRLGRIVGNPFHEAVSEAAHRAGLRFILNVVLDDEKRVLKVVAGDPSAAFEELVSFARSVYEVPITHDYDVAIGGVGYPKDSNLYQASRAASYLFFAPTQVVKPGGYLVIPARCEEGAGEGVGEQRFLAAMRDAADLQFILEESRRNGYPPGQQRAFIMAKVLEQVNVVIVGSEHPDIVTDCRMIPAETIDDALALIAGDIGASLDVLIVPHALLTLPVIRPEVLD